jgi:hypothetical protein
MEVRPGSSTGPADLANPLARGDPSSWADLDAAQMGVKGGDAAAVIDRDHVAVATNSTRKRHCAFARGGDWRSEL